VISPEDADAIERATLRALPPRVLETDDGWLLTANDGVISRANSVLPLSAGADPIGAKIDRAIAFYTRQGLKPALRVSPFAQPRGLGDVLAARGFAPDMTTLVMTMPIESAAAASMVALAQSPDASWRALFIAPGVGGSEADIRVATLSRGEGTRFASLAVEGETVAIGAASVSGDWVGVHGMRTLTQHRGRGYGAAVLSSLLADARNRGAERAFLQVEASNTDAIRLYERLGLQSAYAYDYWRS
jgi:GNAT superfamily N-acetyltransferase